MVSTVAPRNQGQTCYDANADDNPHGHGNLLEDFHAKRFGSQAHDSDGGLAAELQRFADEPHPRQARADRGRWL